MVQCLDCWLNLVEPRAQRRGDLEWCETALALEEQSADGGDEFALRVVLLRENESIREVECE
jgi:hypothetical protein